MVINRLALESILKHIYEGVEVKWDSDGSAAMEISPVRILDKVMFHDSVKKNADFAGT